MSQPQHQPPRTPARGSDLSAGFLEYRPARQPGGHKTPSLVVSDLLQVVVSRVVAFPKRHKMQVVVVQCHLSGKVRVMEVIFSTDHKRVFGRHPRATEPAASRMDRMAWSQVARLPGCRVAGLM